MGNQTKGEFWSKISRMPLTMPETMFMMKEMVMEGRNGFQTEQGEDNPFDQASSRSTMISARTPKVEQEEKREDGDMKAIMLAR